MLTDERKRLMETVESDIAVHGWDQPARLWVLHKADDGDEYLELVMREIPGHPADFLERAKIWGTLDPSKVAGVVLSSEGWTFPDRVTEPLRSLPPAEQRRILEKMNPPSSFEDRKELRQVFLVTSAGEVYAMMRARDEEAEFFDGNSGQFGGRLVDALRGILGYTPEAQLKAFQHFLDNHSHPLGGYLAEEESV